MHYHYDDVDESIQCKHSQLTSEDSAYMPAVSVFDDMKWQSSLLFKLLSRCASVCDAADTFSMEFNSYNIFFALDASVSIFFDIKFFRTDFRRGKLS